MTAVCGGWRTGAVAFLFAWTAARTASAQPLVDHAGAVSPTAPTPPVLLTRVEAAYPPDAQRQKLEATVGLEVVVDEHGGVVDARVTTPAGHGFDEAALDAIRKFTFGPAHAKGAPVRSVVQLAYEFHLPQA